jgi:EAL and modified HD-GYP domain-containing signal transduction protein
MHNSHLPLLARQPILDTNLQVIGYELLCRPLPEDNREWQEKNGDFATSEVVISAYQELGFEKVTGGLPAFINFTRNWLFNPPFVSSNLLVAEVLEYIEADDETIRAIESIRNMNYQVALDDFLGEPHQVQLLPYVDIVKVDILELNDLSKLEPMLQQYQRPGLTWLAEKVETPEEYDACRKAGFTLFQGYFFAKPVNIYGKRLPDNKLSVLQLLETLNQPEAEIEDISRTLQSEPQLSFRLLQLINSAAVGCSQEVTSIRQAIMLAGLDKIKTWAQILALGKLSDKPAILREQSVLRGFLAQELACNNNRLDFNAAFTLGLFSLLPAFLDISMKEVCERLKLPEQFNQALLEQQGGYGEILALVDQIEHAQWDNVDWLQLADKGINASSIVSAYQTALQSTRELMLKA